LAIPFQNVGIMAVKKKIGLLTIFLSNRHYLTEIPVEGKVSSKFNLSITLYDRYISQIIRAGNCITLVTTKYEITEQSFWNINYFEDYAKYVFWTVWQVHYPISLANFSDAAQRSSAETSSGTGFT
jgi:hypothetical protein